MTGYVEGMAAGLSVLFVWPNILYPVVGTLAAMCVSFLPGVSGVTLMSLALPLTLAWEPLPVALLFGALVGGATFMGSVTAILFNVPGAAPNAATMIDGHPLTQRGLARTALGCAATASGVGSCIGVIILVAILPVVRDLLLAFGPPEFLLMGLWGLTTIILTSGAAPLKAVAATGLGLSAALIGLDPRTAEQRWTWGADYLADGLPVIPVLLGLFGVAELIKLMTSGRSSISRAADGPRDSGRVVDGVIAVLQHRWLLLRCSIVGVLVGIVPGIGGTVAGFVAYGHAVQSARDRSQFGCGDIRGVLAPEAAHDAKDGGSLLPALAFGLPGSEGTIILLAALALHGVAPGQLLLDEHLPLTFALIGALVVSNCLTSLVGLCLAGQLARLTTLRLEFLVPIILALVLVAATIHRGQPADLWVVVVFGLLGYIMQRYGWPRIPLVIAFVLGAMIEDNLLLTVRLLELDRLELFERPITLVIASLGVVTFGAAFAQHRRRRGGTEKT